MTEETGQASPRVPDGPLLGRKGMRRVARPRSLTAIVVDQIRDLIVTGGLSLGEQLSENALAERLGVSRTPVREAFLRLEAERLVEIRPQRGTFVFLCDSDEVRDVCELREILEAGALRLAIEKDRHGLLKALERSLLAAEKAVIRTSADYQPFDHEFHGIIVNASGNRQLIEAYGQISGRIRALRYRLIRTLDQVQGSKSAHREVTDHVAKGEDQAAQAALSHHVYSSYRSLLELFEPGVVNIQLAGGG